MAGYNMGDLKKGLKVQVDGDPFLITECNFVKPGKGQAMYKLRLKNLLKGTTIDRTYRSGDQIDAADVTEVETQYLYKQGETWVFMNKESFDQIEMTNDQVDEAGKFLKEGMDCQMTLWNSRPIALYPPNHVVLRVEYCEPAARGNTSNNITKPVKLETGAEIQAPAFVEMGELIRIDTRTGDYVERVKE
ncbi:MAG TPA: elongation factor P [Pirellulales bacterium]